MVRFVKGPPYARGHEWMGEETDSGGVQGVTGGRTKRGVWIGWSVVPPIRYLRRSSGGIASGSWATELQRAI